MVGRKKAQVKIQQMAFMIIGLTLFFVLVGLFVLSFGLSGLQESKDALDEERATLLVGKLSDAPEFLCGGAYGTRKSNCIDMDKIFILKENIENYKNFWEVEGITILVLSSNSTLECNSNNYPECGRFIVLGDGKSGIDKSDFVSLCRKEKSENLIYDKCELGKLIVRISNE